MNSELATIASGSDDDLRLTLAVEAGIERIQPLAQLAVLLAHLVQVGAQLTRLLVGAAGTLDGEGGLAGDAHDALIQRTGGEPLDSGERAGVFPGGKRAERLEVDELPGIVERGDQRLDGGGARLPLVHSLRRGKGAQAAGCRR